MPEQLLPEEFRTTGLHVHRVNSVPLTQFQVIGERASATNLVRKILQSNAAIMRTEALGWKHAPPYMAAVPPDFLVVCVVRDARAWALSMHKRPWHMDPNLQSLPFSDFIRTPWRGIVDRVKDFEGIHPEIADRVQGAELQHDRHPISGLPYRNIFDMRRVKLQAHLGMLRRGCNVLVVRAGVVQSNPLAFARWFMEAFEILQRKPELAAVSRRMGNNFSPTAPNRPQTPQKMSSCDTSFMKGELDLDLEAQLGFEY